MLLRGCFGLCLFLCTGLLPGVQAQPLPAIPQPTSPLGEATRLQTTPTPESLAVSVPGLNQPTPLTTWAENPVIQEQRPIPGSLLDDFTTEYEARRAFRLYTWRGTAISALPNTLLWNPGLAVKRDPKMQVTYSDLRNYRSSNTVDASIGGTQGLFRLAPEGADFETQLDIFGVVHTRLSPDDLMFADYRFGIPITWRWGWWQGKIAYEHTSAHLGDELIASQGRFVRSWSKDELVLGLGMFVTDNLRVYGNYGYALQFVVPDVLASTRTRSRYDIGAEWLPHCPTGFAGSPFGAANAEWRGEQNFTPNITLQAGWMWRNPFQREGQFRIFVEHYRGRSPFSQDFTTKESFTSIGMGFDF